MADGQELGALAGLGGGLGYAALMGSNPAGWLAAAGLGLSGGGILGGIFGKKKKSPSIDISAELAKINALFEQQKAAARIGINQDAAQARSEIASNLAARGTYSSPVSEYSFGRLAQTKTRALAESDAAIGGRQAEAQATLFSGLLGYDQQNRLLAAQQDAAMSGQLGALGGALLSVGLQGGAFGGKTAGMPSSEFNTWKNQYKRPQGSFFNFPTGNSGPYSNLIFQR